MDRRKRLLVGLLAGTYVWSLMYTFTNEIYFSDRVTTTTAPIEPPTRQSLFDGVPVSLTEFPAVSRFQ